MQSARSKRQTEARKANFSEADPGRQNAMLHESTLKLLFCMVEREGLEPSTPAL